MLYKRFSVILMIGILFAYLGNDVLAKNEKHDYQEIFDRNVPQTFHYKVEYDELYSFLNMTQQEFDAEWKTGKTIAEIAEKRGVFPAQLKLYCAEKQFEALEVALENKGIDRYFYYDYAISQMNDDIDHFINQNPH